MSFDKDVRYLSVAVPELEHYLLSKELYYPIGSNLPQLTLGGALLSIMRLGGKAAKFEAQVGAIKSKWRTAWDAKAGREVSARSALWAEYLSEYREDARAGARLYSQNIRYRAMITALGAAEDGSDVFLRSVFIEGNFIWEAECAPNFNRRDFWYLFGSIKQE